MQPRMAGRGTGAGRVNLSAIDEIALRRSREEVGRRKLSNPYPSDAL